MSQVPQPLDLLPLFAGTAPESVEIVHDAAELEHAAFFERVRRLVAGHYAGSGRAISMDEVHEIMEKFGIKLPAGASPNVLGSMLSGWSRARRAPEMIRSKRLGSKGNVLMTWTIA